MMFPPYGTDDKVLLAKLEELRRMVENDRRVWR